MIKLHQPIETQREKIPFSWVLLINVPWFIGLYTMFVMGTALPLTLRRYTDDLFLIGLLTSVGLWFGIILGPVVNYISDRIWSRWGRRRPFLLVAVAGSLLAMTCIPFAASLTPIILLVVVSSILGDVGSTQEPLWLEVIPPAQRGSAIAVRILCVNMASLFFFQLMFAQFDEIYRPVLFGYEMQLTGEQMCYLLGAGLQIIHIGLLLFIYREIKPAGVELKKITDLQDEFPFVFFKGFFSNVFSDKRWWWIYLYYTSGAFIGPSLGIFNNLMLVEQFQYAKPLISLTGLPTMILSNLLVTPVMGWFADKLPKLHWWMLVAVIGACGWGLHWNFITYLPEDPMVLPKFWESMMVLCLLGTLVGMSLMLLLLQVLRSFFPSYNPRLWAWILGSVNAVFLAGSTFLIIQSSPSNIPPLTVWFLLMCLSNGTNCLGIVSGPLLYEYIPKDKIGTISSGFGLLNTALTAALQTLVGAWVKFYANDYSSAYLLVILLSIFTFAASYFFMRAIAKGLIVEYGRLGLNSHDQPPPATKP